VTGYEYVKHRRAVLCYHLSSVSVLRLVLKSSNFYEFPSSAVPLSASCSTQDVKLEPNSAELHLKRESNREDE
jgi:hypothetical protein